ncbi:uncharacterized protein [Temnothorax nylanderi]|uniref:uncharacterized protein isoform X2 n=1 Tax=Temnothorax nylanderi TaxID=102681 RepID=UPI003A87F577
MYSSVYPSDSVALRKAQSDYCAHFRSSSSYTQMALETPAWLNLCFVEKILRKSEGDNSIQVIDIFSKPATAKGDNYSSDMIRVTAEFSRDQGDSKITEKKSIIVKISPIAEGVRQDFIKLSGVFDIEILMMSDTLDKMNKLLGPEHRLSGKGLYVQNKNPTLLVIEDLAPLGFRMADRLSGLDLAHTILALDGLARFHAASVAICEKEPKQKEMYTKGIFNDQYPLELRNFFVMSCKALADEVANWPGMKKSHSPDLFHSSTSDDSIRCLNGCNSRLIHIPYAVSPKMPWKCTRTAY